jgi:hypothetical protein
MNSGSPVPTEAVERLLDTSPDGFYKASFLENAVFGRSSQNKPSSSTSMNKGKRMGRGCYAPALDSRSSLGIIGGQLDGHREGSHPVAPLLGLGS